MKSFQLRNKNNENKILEQQKVETEIAKQNENLNTAQKNSQTTGALVMGIIAILIIFIPSGGFVSIILVIFAARRLLKAKKLGENKKYMSITYILVYMPVLIWIVGSIVSAFSVIE